LVKEVLKRLKDNDLYTKAEKCFFEQSSIKYLGIIIPENKVQMDQEKLSGALEWPIPTKVKQVQAFLDFANFYCRFIENFAKMSKLLSNLTKKDSTWTWGIDQQNAFEALKKAFTTAPVLRIPNDEDLFKLSTDASDFATGVSCPCDTTHLCDMHSPQTPAQMLMSAWLDTQTLPSNSPASLT